MGSMIGAPTTLALMRAVAHQPGALALGLQSYKQGYEDSLYRGMQETTPPRSSVTKIAERQIGDAVKAVKEAQEI